MHRSASSTRVSDEYYMTAGQAVATRSAMDIQHLPMYDPQLEIAKKETARLRLAEHTVHLIPVIIIICAMLLWFFSNPEGGSDHPYSWPQAHHLTSTIGFTQGFIPIFSGELYEQWSDKMTTLLRSQDLWDIVKMRPKVNEKATGDAGSKLSEDEAMKYASALFLIQQGVAPYIYPRIMGKVVRIKIIEIEMAIDDDSVLARIKNMSIDGYSNWNSTSMTIGLEDLDPIDGFVKEETAKDADSKNKV